MNRQVFDQENFTLEQFQIKFIILMKDISLKIITGMAFIVINIYIY